ncbi:hypothetical protein [Alkaliphilus crotonatoxidans]
MKQKIWNKTLKLLKISVSSILILSLISLLYSLIKKGPILKNIFNFNFFLASIIIAYGVVTFFLPISLKKTKRLVDHSNVADVVREEKEKKYEGAIESILWGIMNILIVGIIEIIVKAAI